MPEKSPPKNMKPSSNSKENLDARLDAALKKAKKLKGSGVDYGKLTVEALNKATSEEKKD